jgi:aryl-alcohol dehydrogenase-like predicted oxidoreductase
LPSGGGSHADAGKPHKPSFPEEIFTVLEGRQSLPKDDFRRNDPRYQGENYDANVKAAQTVRDIAESLGAKPGQIALAWLLHKGDHVVPIPGTKRRKYLEENVAAAAITLDAALMKTLDDAMAPEKISGPRYGEKMLAMVDR